MSLKYKLTDFSIGYHLEPDDLARLRAYFARAEEGQDPQARLSLASFIYNRASNLHPVNHGGEEIAPPVVLKETFDIALDLFRGLAREKDPDAIHMIELYNNREWTGMKGQDQRGQAALTL